MKGRRAIFPWSSDIERRQVTGAHLSALLFTVSYDMVIQRFERGDAAPMPTATFVSVFGPCVAATEPEFGFRRLSAPDGGGADVYADLTGDSFASAMFNHFSCGAVLDLVARFLVLADAVVLLPDVPALLANEEQRPHLPAVLCTDAIVVRSGSDIEAAVRRA